MSHYVHVLIPTQWSCLNFAVFLVMTIHSIPRSLSATLNLSDDSNGGGGELTQSGDQLQQAASPATMTITSDTSTAIATTNTAAASNDDTKTSNYSTASSTTTRDTNTSTNASDTVDGRSLSPTATRRAVTPDGLQSQALSGPKEATWPPTASLFSTLPRTTHHRTPENIKVLHRRSWNYATAPHSAGVVVSSSDTAQLSNVITTAANTNSVIATTSSGSNSPLKLTDFEVLTDSEDRPDTAMSHYSVASSTRSTTPTTPSPLSLSNFSAPTPTPTSTVATPTTNHRDVSPRDRFPIAAVALSNHRQSVGGLRKALSMYQENRRQSLQARQSRLRSTPERRVSEEVAVSDSSVTTALRVEEEEEESFQMSVSAGECVVYVQWGLSHAE